jgi:nicotinamidase-related amidase
MSVTLQLTDALVLVDVQNDFLPGGALAVPDGDAVVPALNRYIAAFLRKGLPILVTRDWHPPDHCSFRDRGGPWPPHCVAFSRGAAFATLLQLPCDAVIVSKAETKDQDAYSGFEGTDLDARLRALGAKRLLVGGLATDYCVLGTVRDALAKGYEALLLRDAIRAVNVSPGDGDRAEREMVGLGARPITIHDFET